MARRKFSPVRLGVWGMLLIVLAGAGRCGRERENPVDPNFPGGGALQPPGNIRAQGDIGRILLTWDAVKINELAGYGVWRATSATGDYTRLRGESNDANVTTGRTVFVDSTMDVSASRVYFYRLTTVDVNGQSSERSSFVSAEVQRGQEAAGFPRRIFPPSGTKPPDHIVLVVGRAENGRRQPGPDRTGSLPCLQGKRHRRLVRTDRFGSSPRRRRLRIPRGWIRICGISIRSPQSTGSTTKARAPAPHR